MKFFNKTKIFYVTIMVTIIIGNLGFGQVISADILKLRLGQDAPTPSELFDQIYIDNDTTLWCMNPIGELKTLTSSHFNVKDYGAKGDGETVDTDAIQTTLDAAGENGGGVVYFPQGIYIFSDTLWVKSNTMITGEGKNCSILEADGYHCGFLMNTVSNVYIGHLQIKNIKSENSPVTENHGIRVNGGQYITIEHCKLDSCDDAGIRIGYYIIDNVRHESHHCKVLYNVVTNTEYGCGIEIIIGDNVLCHGNTVVDSKEHGIRLCGASETIVSNNHCYNNGNTGISIQGFGSDIDILRQVWNVLVHDNFIKNSVCGQSGIAISNEAHDISIIGNTIVNSQMCDGRSGIRIRQGSSFADFEAREIEIKNNSIYGFTRGIDIRGDTKHVFVKNNCIKEFNGREKNAYGIHITNKANPGCYDLSEIFIEGNEIVNTNPGSSYCGIYGIAAFRYNEEQDLKNVYVMHNKLIMKNPGYFIGGDGTKETKLYVDETGDSIETNIIINIGN